MEALDFLSALKPDATFDESLFGLIVEDIVQQGYSIRPGALPEKIGNALAAHQATLNGQKYVEAGIGRGDDYAKNQFVRTDEICWITGQSEAVLLWLDWTERLKHYLNRQLYLGLFSFESHFAHYAPGDYYKRHYDAFHGRTNRILTIVTYLNPNWAPSDKGELVLYQNDLDREGVKVVPLLGTIAIFLSQQFPHEVLPATRDRYSVTGWFRVNGSMNNRIDPPR